MTGQTTDGQVNEMKEFFELTKEQKARAESIHKRSIVIDMCNVAHPIHPNIIDGEIFRTMQKGGETASGVTLVDRHPFYKSTFPYLALWHKLFETRPEIMLATTADDITRAKSMGKVAIIGAFQNAAPIQLEDDVNMLTIYHRLGIRVIQLTYNEANIIGTGCYEKKDAGLSEFGVKVVEEMNNLHMVIDLSHCGINTTMETLEISKDPVLYTHSNPRALCDSPRNKTDEQIKALAERGGVMGISSYSPFAFVKKGVRPTVKDFIDFVDYAVKLVGVDFVGIGTDIADGYVGVDDAMVRQKQAYPGIFADWTVETERGEGLDHVDCYPNVTKGLVAHGYSDQEIEKMLGGNFMRVFKRVFGK